MGRRFWKLTLLMTGRQISSLNSNEDRCNIDQTFSNVISSLKAKVSTNDSETNMHLKKWALKIKESRSILSSVRFDWKSLPIDTKMTLQNYPPSLGNLKVDVGALVRAVEDEALELNSASAYFLANRSRTVLIPHSPRSPPSTHTQ